MAKHPHNPLRPPSPATVLAVEILREEGDVEPLRATLTPRQRAFAEEYVVDYNATAACIRAGYASKNAEKQAHTLSKHVGVAAYIDYLTRSKEAKIVSIDPDYVIARIAQIVNKEGAKDGDKLRGLELLARHLGMFIERTELTGKDGGAIAIEQQKTKEEVDSFLNTLKVLQERADQKKDVKLI